MDFGVQIPLVPMTGSLRVCVHRQLKLSVDVGSVRETAWTGMEQIFGGVFILLVVDAACWARGAADVATRSLTGSLVALSEALEVMWTSLLEDKCPGCRCNAARCCSGFVGVVWIECSRRGAS